MKLLLHTCCAPCLIYPLERLKEKNFEVSGLFYNPNIHPFSEYKNRRQAVEDYSKAIGLEMFYPDYQPQEFFRVINPVRSKTPKATAAPLVRTSNGINPVRKFYISRSIFSNGVNMMEEKPKRCPICWYQRLRTTAQIAREKGFTYFSSTLLVSPYQDQELLNKIGADIADEEGIEFYSEDFRPGFREAHNKAKAQGIYCQNYCGCIYSKIERCRKLAKH